MIPMQLFTIVPPDYTHTHTHTHIKTERGKYTQMRVLYAHVYKCFSNIAALWHFTNREFVLLVTTQQSLTQGDLYKI